MDGYWSETGIDRARAADGFYDTGDVGFISLPDGRRIAVAMFARGGGVRPR
jgi:hypothetical protein